MGYYPSKVIVLLSIVIGIGYGYVLFNTLNLFPIKREAYLVECDRLHYRWADALCRCRW